MMAQRLVRRLDDSTKQAYQPDEALKARLKTVIDSLPPGTKNPISTASNFIKQWLVKTSPLVTKARWRFVNS